MAGKRDTGRVGADLIAARVKALLAATDGLPLDELERRAKMLTQMAKAGQAVNDLAILEDMTGDHDERLDAVGEQRLRDRLLRRLDEIEAEMEAQADPAAPRSGGVETD